MIPTDEQVKQIVREAGLLQDGDCFYSLPDEVDVTIDDLRRVILIAMATQAEAFAALCEARAQKRFEEFGYTDPDSNASYYTGASAETYQSMDAECEELAADTRSIARTLRQAIAPVSKPEAG